MFQIGKNVRSRHVQCSNIHLKSEQKIFVHKTDRNYKLQQAYKDDKNCKVTKLDAYDNIERPERIEFESVDS